jgi:hypothetical protein
MFTLLFDLEDGGNDFLQNNGETLPDYTASHSRRSALLRCFPFSKSDTICSTATIRFTECIQLAQDRAHLWAIVRTLTDLQVS